MNVPIRTDIGFQPKDRQDSQNLNKDNFCRLPIASAQCLIGTEKLTHAGIFLNYDVDDYSRGYSQIKEALRALTKDDILQPYISDDNLRSSKAGVVELGFKTYVFELRYQQKFTASGPIKLEIKFGGVIPNDVNGYALVLTKNLVSINSDGQRHFDSF